MKIAVVSNWEPERCGNVEYANNLLAQLRTKFDADPWPACPDTGGYDCVIINHHPPVLGFTLEQVQKLQSFGTKVILIVQESNPEYWIDANSTFCKVDAVIAHEPCQIHGAPVNFKFIPHGAPVVDNLSTYGEGNPLVGTAGFAFPSKHMDLAVRIASLLGGSALIIAPQHHLHNASELYAQWRGLGNVEIVTEWLSQEETVRRLSACAMNLYFADEPAVAPGQSGSALMMAAARRPLIIRECRKTNALRPYQDELYFERHDAGACHSAAHIISEIRAGKTPKVPFRLMRYCGWGTVGSMFCDVVDEVFKKQVTTIG